MPTFCTFRVWIVENQRVELIPGVLDDIAQSHLHWVFGDFRSRRIPDFGLGAIAFFFEALGEAKALKYQVAVLAKSLEEFAVQQGNAGLAYGRVQAVSQIGVEVVKGIDAAGHVRVGAVASQLPCLFQA